MFAASPPWLVSFAWVLSLRFALADIFSHCVFHVFVLTTTIAFLAFIIYRLRKNKVSGGQWGRRFLLLFVPAFFLFFCTRPWELIPLISNKKSDKATKILVWNVYLMNQHLDEIDELIRRHDPDIVAVIECNDRLAEKLSELRTHYTSEMWTPGWHSQGVVVLTKLPETKIKKQFVYGMQLTQVSFRPRESNKTHQLYVLHTLSPGWPGDRVDTRNRQLLDTVTLANENEVDPQILMGDFNTSPWSQIFRQALSQGNLIDTRRYRGYFSSWPSFFYDFGIPIDHALVNEKVNVISREVLSDGIGSDHRPVILEIE